MKITRKRNIMGKVEKWCHFRSTEVSEEERKREWQDNEGHVSRDKRKKKKRSKAKKRVQPEDLPRGRPP